MKFPVDEIIKNDKNKYKMSMAMIKYAVLLEEHPELLKEHSPKDIDQRLKIIISDILTEKIKFKFIEKEVE